MIVEYDVNHGGELKVRDVSGKTLILHDAFWTIRTVPENKIYDILYGLHPRAPSTEIPDRLFEGLFYGIRRYHKDGSKDNMMGYCKPSVMKLKNHIKSLERGLIDTLEKDCNYIFSRYWHKELVA